MLYSKLFMRADSFIYVLDAVEECMTEPVQHATHAIPQADVLWDVIRVPIAVRAGACDPESLAAALGARVARQAVYYTQAARILGLIAEGPAGAPLQLTSYGHAFVHYDVQEQRGAMPPDGVHRADAFGGGSTD